MLLLESLYAVSYSHSIATIDVFLAVSTHYTNTTDRQTPSQTDITRRHSIVWLELSRNHAATLRYRAIITPS